jgi:hypothetical protein
MIACVCLCVAIPAAVPARDLLDRVLAVVSGTIITLSDVRAAIELGFIDTRDARDPVGVGVTRLIERRLVLDEALRYETPDPDMVSVEAMLLWARQRYASEAEWESAKRRLGLTDDGIRTMAADILLVELFVERRFEAQPLPSEPDVQAYFDRHRAAFVRDGRPMTFAEARADVEARIRQERRTQAANEWVARLRRRADVSELYTPVR